MRSRFAGLFWKIFYLFSIVIDLQVFKTPVRLWVSLRGSHTSDDFNMTRVMTPGETGQDRKYAGGLRTNAGGRKNENIYSVRHEICNDLRCNLRDSIG